MRDPEQAAYIRQHGENPRYLKGVKINPLVEPVCDLEQVIAESELIFVALPSTALREALQPFAGQLAGKMLISTTKGIVAIAVAMCVQRGLFDYSDKVATYWPEFAQNGKEGVLVRHVLAHTAGLPGWDPAIGPDDLYDQDLLAANLASHFGKS